MGVSNRSDEAKPSQAYDVVIVGAGLGGLGTAAKLKQAGLTNIAVFERASDLGGVWRANRYPNVACDTPIDLYAFSFFPGDKWSTNFAPGNEIWDYLGEFADRYDVRSSIAFNTEIVRATWEDGASHWIIETRDGRRCNSRFLVWAGGLLSRPLIPRVPGIDLFKGEMLHTTSWSNDVRLEGKSVAVVGGGATAIQVTPYAAKQARQAHIFVRTPSYVLPRPDLFFGQEDRSHPDFSMRQKERREEWFRLFEKIAEARFPMNSPLIAEQEAEWRKHFDREIHDPRLREILTPNYRFGCKRPLFSNDYYPALRRPNVNVIGSGVSRLTEDSIIDAEGNSYPVDVIIWATGFDTVNMLGGLEITGRNGRTLDEAWRVLPEAYYGTLVKGFPNLFLINGPNVSGASATDFIEGQIDLIIDAMKSAARRGARTIDVSPDTHDAFNRDIQRRAETSVLVRGNCFSWYRVGGDGGVFTHWPGTIESFRAKITGEARAGLDFDLNSGLSFDPHAAKADTTAA